MSASTELVRERGIGPGWSLEGADGLGNRIRLRLDLALLRASPLGVVIGRHPALAELVVDDASVSRRHCRLGLLDGQLCLEDLSSLNGTWLDDQPLARFRPSPILPGQQLGLGRVTLLLGALPAVAA